MSTIERIATGAECIAASLFFTVFPSDCRICQSPLIEISRLPVCSYCLSSIRPLAIPLCARCGEALPSLAGGDHLESEFAGSGNELCRICELAEPPFERAVAFGSYEGVLRDLVHLLKFDQVRPSADTLGRLMAGTIQGLEPTLPAGTIAVVPVPLHRRKQAQRGFNQAELIVSSALKQLSHSAGLGDIDVKQRFELCRGVIARLRDTGSQIGLSRHQRRKNLRGAFAVQNATPILHQNVLLVDDVYTTGATALECARVLRKAGASAIWVVTVGRTLRVYDSYMAAEALEVERSMGNPGDVAPERTGDRADFAV